MKSDLVLLKGTVVSPLSIIEEGAVLVRDGKIEAVGPAQEVDIPPRAEVIDCSGKTIAPGFIDLHLQGAGGCDCLDGTYQAINTISKTIAKFGTTSFLGTTVLKDGAGQPQRHLEAIAEAVESGTEGASVLGIHLEGPYINPKKRGMIRRENVAASSIEGLNQILEAARGKLKMMTIAPEMDGSLQLISELRKRGVVASLGHTEATYEEAVQGIKAGITHVTHIFNAMSPLHHRRPGAIGAVLLDPKVTVQLIADGIHLHPGAIRTVVRMKGIEGIALITDSMSATGMPEGTYQYDGQPYISKAGTAKYQDGTLIGTSLTLNAMVRNMVKLGGVSLQEAIIMATLNPARIIGVDNKKGSLEAGKDADIVVMDQDCNVKLAMGSGLDISHIL